MININNKTWDKLRFDDIKNLLSGTNDENFFYEFKSDDETPAKLIKEISAFANTYGGYILLGVNDNKTIGGCTKWTEQRIHTTIHDSITPVPNFDVKKFKPNGQIVFVIKIEEGTLPPYITNKGQIFERISSGSFPINDSSKLSQLYHKREEQINRIKNKIELEPIIVNQYCPCNLCGYLDLGFSIVCSEPTELQKNFYKKDMKPVAEYLQTTNLDFSISRVGTSYLISIGKLSARDGNGNEILMNSGINNFLEIMCDGCVKCRIILSNTANESKVDISWIGALLFVFRKIYTIIFGEKFPKIFVHAHKYERLTVLKQFTPYYKLVVDATPEDKYAYQNYLELHQQNYGNNLIIESNRFPKNDYLLIDKRTFSDYKVKYNMENLIKELFYSDHFNLGFIDPPKKLGEE